MDGSRFIRVNETTLVNLDHVVKIEPVYGKQEGRWRIWFDSFGPRPMDFDVDRGEFERIKCILLPNGRSHA